MHVLLAVFLFVFSFCIKLPLVKENAVGFFADEVRYTNYLKDDFNTAIIKEDFHGFWETIFDIQARPAYGILYLPSLYLTNITQNDLFGPLYNLVLNSFCIVLLFFIVKKIFSYKAAFISTGIFLFSMTSVSYIRHMLPYDGALLLFLSGLCVYVYSNSVFLFGVFMGISFAVYPGNYFYIVPIPLLLLFYGSRTPWNMRLRRCAIFLVGMLAVLSFFEYFSISVGKPTTYIQTAMRFSRTVTQGDFVPALQFIVRYVYANDGILGIGIIVSGILTLFYMRKFHKTNQYGTVLLLYVACVYLIMEIMSFGTHSMVLYGRTVRIVYLCLILSSSVWLAAKLRHVSLVFLLMLGLVACWAPRYRAYASVVYPNDFLSLVSSLYVSDAPLHIISSAKRGAADSDVLDLENTGQFYVTNIAFPYPYFGTKKISCEQKTVVLHAPHPLAAYTPYLFEGFSEVQRRSMYFHPLQYQFIHCQ